MCLCMYVVTMYLRSENSARNRWTGVPKVWLMHGQVEGSAFRSVRVRYLSRVFVVLSCRVCVVCKSLSTKRPFYENK